MDNDPSMAPGFVNACIAENYDTTAMQAGSPPPRSLDPRSVRERALWSFAPPLLAFLAVNAVLWVAATAEGYGFFDPATWIRWDSFHYLDIADNGYEYYACARAELWDFTSWFQSVGAFLGFGVELEDVCGDAGWFPGYPAFMRLISFTGLSLSAAGVLIAVFFQLATLYALWIFFLREQERGTALLVLGAGAFFFGHIYYRAVFPMSLAAFLILVHLHLLLKGRWAWAGIAGAMTAFVYPTGVLLAPVGLIWFLGTRSDLPLDRRLVGTSWIAGLTTLGLVLVLLVQYIHTGVWGAFYRVQSQFDYGIHVPTERLIEILTPVFTDGLVLNEVRYLQTGLVAVAMGSLLVATAFRWTRLGHLERWVAIAAAVFWAFPLVIGGEASLYRIESLLLPSVLLLPRSPAALRVFIPVVLVGLSYPMAVLFYRSVLV